MRLTASLLLPITLVFTMTSCRKDGPPSIPASPPETVLKVNAGNDSTIYQPSRTAILRGSYSMANVTRVQWKQVSGPFCHIENPDKATTAISQMDTGVYIFEFTATTYTQKQGVDSVQVSVRPDLRAPDTQYYVHIVQYYSLLRLPENSITLQANAWTYSGTSPAHISSIMWSKIAGPASYQLDSPQAYRTRISNLEEGVYRFRCSVTNTTGTVRSDVATVAVTDPFSPPREIVILNQAWNIDQSGFGYNYLSLNIYDHLPVGKPVKRVFIRPDCFTEWKELSLYDNTSAYEWIYNIYEEGTKLGIEQLPAYPCGMDTPDVKIIY